MATRLLAAVLVLAALTAGCSPARPDSPTVVRRSDQSDVSTRSTELTESPLLDQDGNVVLYVSNQSFEIDPVDIEVRVDGRLVVSKDFNVGSQHNWESFRLSLPAGRHVLTARSKRGEAEIRQPFDVDGNRWLVLDYWFYSKKYGNPPESRHFQFTESDEPMGFQ